MNNKIKNTKRGKSGSALQLWQQATKYMKAANQGSFMTRKTHLDKLSVFFDYIGESFKLQKVENITDTHILSYIDDAFKKGVSSSTVWNTVSAVQYLIRQFPGQTRVSETSDLKKKYLELQRENNPDFKKQDIQRHYLNTGKNPAWTQTEIDRATELALKMQRPDVALSIHFGLELGTRLHETFRQDRAHLDDAIKTGNLVTKGKGGLIRKIPVQTIRSLKIVNTAYQLTSHGNQKPFLKHGIKTHQAMRRVQNWIYNHRDKFSDDGQRQLTYHGLRHTYAQKEFERIYNRTQNEQRALREVAEQMGHHRAWITKIYLESF